MKNKKYYVKRYWEMCDDVTVDAKSQKEAIIKACKLLIKNKNAKYISNSICCDEPVIK